MSSSCNLLRTHRCANTFLVFHDKMDVPLLQKYGIKTSKKLTDIKKVLVTLGIDACRVLIGMHAYTGCNYVSDLQAKVR